MWGDGKDFCTLQGNQDYIYLPTPAKLNPERKVVRMACGDSFTVVVMVTKKQFSSASVKEIYSARCPLSRLHHLQDEANEIPTKEFLTKEMRQKVLSRL